MSESVFVEWISYILNHQAQFWQMAREHLTMVLTGELLAILVAVPLGVVATRKEKLGWVIMNAGAVAQTIPPLGVIAISFVYFGLGTTPVIIALFFYALLPILKNTVAGIRDVDEAKLESGRGMGMTGLQRLRRIELPLALPVIFAGIRTSTVLCIGVAYLGAFIGAGGFGTWVILGQQQFEMSITLAGAIPGAALVIALDQGLKRVESYLTPIGVTAGHGDDVATA